VVRREVLAARRSLDHAFDRHPSIHQVWVPTFFERGPTRTASAVLVVDDAAVRHPSGPGTCRRRGQCGTRAPEREGRDVHAAGRTRKSGAGARRVGRARRGADAKLGRRSAERAWLDHRNCFDVVPYQVGPALGAGAMICSWFTSSTTHSAGRPANPVVRCKLQSKLSPAARRENGLTGR
jgi:hypothetical protein